MQVVA